jgi:hypothetical protein
VSETHKDPVIKSTQTSVIYISSDNATERKKRSQGKKKKMLHKAAMDDNATIDVSKPKLKGLGATTGTPWT